MPRIAGLLDLSRFVRRVDRIQIKNTVHLVIGVVRIEVNGYIISLKSKILEDLVTTQCEIYLDQFVGEEDGIQDCVKLLYGGEVLFNNTNIKTIMKFSVIYQVHNMYQLCMDWTKGNIATVNLFNIIELGLLIEVAKHGNHDVLDLCKNFIKESVQDNLSKLSQTWSFANNNNFIRFLVQDDILYFTLPILTSWISDDSGIRLILEQAEVKGLTQGLFKRGSRTTDLFKKMTDKVELVETSRILLNLQISKGEDVWSSEDLAPSNKDLNSLLSDNYQSFSVEQLLHLEEDYGLEHVEFVDITLNWIMSNTPSQDDVIRLWGNVRQLELEYYYLHRVRSTIVFSHSVSFTVPEIEERDITKYRYTECGWYIPSLSPEQKHSLLNNKTVTLKFQSKCYSDEHLGLCINPTTCVVELRLQNQHPCYVLVDTDCLVVKHWYIWGWKKCYQWYFSLITNNCDYKQHIENGTGTFVSCLYKCRNGKQSQHCNRTEGGKAEITNTITTPLEDLSCKTMEFVDTVADGESACSSKDLTPSNKDLTALLSENYQSYSVEKLLGIEEEYGLEHFEFVDIVLSRIIGKGYTPSNKNVIRLWGNVRHRELEYWYLLHVRHTIVSSHNMSYKVPQIANLSDYHYLGGGFWYINELSTEQLDSLFHNKPVVLMKFLKQSCCKYLKFKLRLQDKHPCYVLDENSRHLIKHWYLRWLGDCGKWYYYSLITNTCSAVIKKIKECLKDRTDIVICCLYKCNKHIHCNNQTKRGR